MSLTGSSEPEKDKYLAGIVSADHIFLCVAPNLSKDDDEVENFMELLRR